MSGTYDGRFEAIVAQVIADEGGYTNHPKDKGGPTNYGITKRFLAEARGVDPSTITTKMIRDLTANDARMAYHKVIWQSNGVHMLPSEIQPLMFDWIVMSGPSTPVRFLQHRVGATPDGIIGPATAKAVRVKLHQVAYRDFQNEFVGDIVRFLNGIAESDPSQKIFLEGWLNRFCGYYQS